VQRQLSLFGSSLNKAVIVGNSEVKSHENISIKFCFIFVFIFLYADDGLHAPLRSEGGGLWAPQLAIKSDARGVKPNNER